MSQEKKATAKKMGTPKLPVLIGCIILIVLLVIGVIIWMARNGSQSTSDVTKPEAAKEEKPAGIEVYPIFQAGTVCPTNKTFSFRLPKPYSVALEGKTGMGVVTNDGMLIIVTKSEATPTATLGKMLGEYNVPYTKKGEQYLFDTPKKIEDSFYELPEKGISTIKNNFIISLFYDPTQKEPAMKMLEAILSSVKGGCK